MSSRAGCIDFRRPRLRRYLYPWCHQMRSRVMIRHTSPPTNKIDPTGTIGFISVLPGLFADAPTATSASPITMQSNPSSCCSLRDLLVLSMVTCPLTGIGVAIREGVTATVIAGATGAGGGAGATEVTRRPLTFATGCHSSIPSRQTTISLVMCPSWPIFESSCDVYGPYSSPFLARRHDFPDEADMRVLPFWCDWSLLTRERITTAARSVQGATFSSRNPVQPKSGRCWTTVRWSELSSVCDTRTGKPKP